MNYTEGLYVTLGRAQMEEKSYRVQIETFLECDGVRAVFGWRLKNRPKRDFVDVYIVIGNRVRWRAKFIGYDSRKTITFNDGKTRTANNWLMLIDFEPMTRPFQKVKGFQGFRYMETLREL